MYLVCGVENVMPSPHLTSTMLKFKVISRINMIINKTPFNSTNDFQIVIV